MFRIFCRWLLRSGNLLMQANEFHKHIDIHTANANIELFPPLDRIDAKDTRNTQYKHSYIEFIIHLMEIRMDVFVCMKLNIYVDFPIRFSFIRRKLNAIRVLCFICFGHLINFLFGWWLLLVGSCHIKLGVDSMCTFVNTFHCHRKPNTVQMCVRRFPRRHNQKTEAAREVITNLLF